MTEKCRTCGGTVQYSAGQREPHPRPENPALVTEGCNAATPLRVEQALADDYLRALEAFQMAIAAALRISELTESAAREQP